MQIIKGILNLVSKLLVLVGFIGFLGWRIILLADIKYESELPLSLPEGIVVNSKGEIFIGLEFYDVIQVYDKNGLFQRHWNVPSSGGSFKMKLVNDEIQVATQRSNLWLTYNRFGNLIKQNNSLVAYDMFPISNEFIDPITEITYKIKDGIIPEIQKIDHGKSRTFIEVPIILFFFLGPFHTWILAGLGMFGMFILNRENLERKRAELMNKY